MNLNVSLPESWSDWKIDSVIGEGSFGVVYKAEREEFGQTFYSAIKVMSVPQSHAAIQEAQMDGMLDEESLRTYFYGIVESWVSEIRMMEDMKGTPNIVGIEDYKVVEKQDTIGWDVFIRMELLTGFQDILRTKELSEKDIIKVGCDICKALEYCERKDIVHRDIKVENIFVSKFGDYKLGDFGVARNLEKTTAGLTQTGTRTYMAPEVYKGDKYNLTVDIYSLGIVLYRLANHGRAPFYPSFPAQFTHQDKINALEKRMAGNTLPKPDNASAELSRVILKATEYDVQKRYHSPKEFRKALEKIQITNKSEETEIIKVDLTDEEESAIEQGFSEKNKTEIIDQDKIRDELIKLEGENGNQSFKNKNGSFLEFTRKIKPGIAAALVIGVAATVGIMATTGNKNTGDETKQEIEAEKPETEEPSITFHSESAMKQIETLVEDHDYKEALAELERLEYSMERKDVDPSEVAEKRKQVKEEQKKYQTLQKYKTVMKKANAYYKKRNYGKAIEQYRKAKKIDKTRAKKPNEMIAKCKEKIKAQKAAQRKQAAAAASSGSQSTGQVTGSNYTSSNYATSSYNNQSSYSAPSSGGSSGSSSGSGNKSGGGSGGGSKKTENPFEVTEGDDFAFSVD